MLGGGLSLPKRPSRKPCSEVKKLSLPLSSGNIGDQKITVLRDTDSTGVVVKCRLVRDDQFMGKNKIWRLVDGSQVTTHVARIYVETPYYTGYVEDVYGTPSV